MPKQILLLFSLLTAIASFAQTEISFKPKWKVGDKRTAIIITHDTEYKGDELTEETTETLEVVFEIVKESATDYTVKVTMDNIALSPVAEMYDKIADELPKYKSLVLMYQVNKLGGTADLLNWKESKAFILESFEQAEKLLKKKLPEDVEYAKMLMNPIVSLFSSKEAVEGYMENVINYLVTPYSQAFVLNDTVKVERAEVNPFNASEEMSTTHLYYLTEKGKGIYNLNYSIQFDMSGFVAMMKEMMSEMGKSFGVEDSSIVKKNAEFDDITFNMTNYSDWVYNATSGWLTSVTTKTEIYGTDPSGKRRNVSETSVTYK